MVLLSVITPPVWAEGVPPQPFESIDAMAAYSSSVTPAYLDALEPEPGFSLESMCVWENNLTLVLPGVESLSSAELDLLAGHEASCLILDDIRILDATKAAEKLASFRGHGLLLPGVQEIDACFVSP